MAITSTMVALASLAVGAASAVSSYEGRKEAQQQARNAAAENAKARAEQQALNAQDAAREKRNQVREERVRRAKLEQASQNSGTAGSSGEAGALGSLSTQLGTNLGINAGRLQAANNISQYTQNAANFSTAAQEALNGAQNADALFGVSASIFSNAGGVKTMANAYEKK